MSIFFKNNNIVHHLKLAIELAFPALKERKIEPNISMGIEREIPCYVKPA